VAPPSAVCEFASSSSPTPRVVPLADPPTVRFSTTGANMVCRTNKERGARSTRSILVPALLALATPCTNMIVG
jgi:hypothetical protein